MPDLYTTITITRRKGRDNVDNELRVRSLEELYNTCRDAPPSKVTRISIKGPDGEVRLNFGSFIKRA
jgi:hypothetical protein